MAKIRTLLVGCGKMGRNHLRVLRENSRFEVVGIVDPRAEARALAEGLDIPWRRQIPADGYHAAIAATPAEVREQTIAQLAGRGIPTLVEKPLATTWVEARTLVSAKLVVGHIERFNPAVRALRKVLQTGEIGSVLQVVTSRVGSPPPATQANVVFDLAVHDIDVCRLIFGAMRVETAECEKEAATIALLTIDGVNITVDVDWTSPQKVRTLELVATKGSARLDYQAQTLKMNEIAIPVLKDEPLRAELDAFATFVETGELGDLCPSEDGAAAVRLCEMALTPRGFV